MENLAFEYTNKEKKYGFDLQRGQFTGMSTPGYTLCLFFPHFPMIITFLQEL